jgi:hypothetical protein
MLQQPFARRSQQDTRPIAFEKLHFEMLLQLMDMLGHRRLGDKKFPRGLGKIKPAGYRMKDL